MRPQALARRPPPTGSAPVRLPAVEHGCSSRGRGEGHSPPCLKAGALWPQNGRRDGFGTPRRRTLTPGTREARAELRTPSTTDDRLEARANPQVSDALWAVVEQLLSTEPPTPKVRKAGVQEQ